MNTIELLKTLIACPSITPKSAGCLELIGDFLKQAGFNLTSLPAGNVDNLLITKGKTIQLLFAGHVDVVPAGDIEQWHCHPFTPKEENGYLIGRGSADMKSGVAAMVMAAANAASDGVGIFLTSDEEGDAIHGTQHFVKWWQEKQRENIPYVIVGEPTSERVFGDSIKIGRRGSLTGHLRIYGQQEHVAYGHRGENSAHLLITMLNELVQKFSGNLTLQKQGKTVTTLQVVSMKCGTNTTNITPPFSEAIINFRFSTTDTADSLKKETEEILQRIAPDKWHSHWENSATPYMLSSDNNPLVSSLKSAILEKLPDLKDVALITSGGVSDGRFLRDISTNLVEFGVCNHSIHAPNEHVRLSDVLALQAIYESVIHRLLNNSAS